MVKDFLEQKHEKRKGTMADFFPTKIQKTSKASSANVEKFHQIIALWTATSLRPFSIVEDRELPKYYCICYTSQRRFKSSDKKHQQEKCHAWSWCCPNVGERWYPWKLLNVLSVELWTLQGDQKWLVNPFRNKFFCITITTKSILINLINKFYMTVGGLLVTVGLWAIFETNSLTVCYFFSLAVDTSTNGWDKWIG